MMSCSLLDFNNEGIDLMSLRHTVYTDPLILWHVTDLVCSVRKLTELMQVYCR